MIMIKSREKVIYVLRRYENYRKKKGILIVLETDERQSLAYFNNICNISKMSS
jgi:hypothetical protein